MVVSALERGARVYVAGHRGLVGSAICRHLQDQGFTDIVGRTSRELDLRDRDSTLAFLEQTRPEVVVVAAARVGGILANSTQPVEFLSDNVRIQTNLLDGAHAVGVDRLLFLGSSCIYPKLAPQPIREDSLLTGPLEPTNQAYAIAKIAGVLAVQAYREEYGHRWISAMPTNLFGPGDNFDPQTSHVLPAMLRRFHEAAQTGAEWVTLWGSGTPRREFLHVDDLASACLYLLEHYDHGDPINVGTGSDIGIRELAEIIAVTVGFQGRLEWDTTKPDGTPRKLLDVDRLGNLGWKASISLREGISATYDWYRARDSNADGLVPDRWSGGTL